MAKITALTGFPEWLPEQRLVEQRLIEQVRTKFELFGFTPLETRSVEPLDVLTKKGATDKEIYVLRRLHAEESEQAELGLHFDLTVPFARYVTQHRGALSFPFKRYQIQKVWRGERPQQGRYREFYQADIDVIGDGELSVHFDAEMALLLHEVVSSLPIPKIELRINNRKVLEGFYRALGLTQIGDVLRTVDKLDKIGEDGVKKGLCTDNGLSEAQAEQCLSLARISGAGADVIERVRALGAEHPLLDEGLHELSFVLRALEGLPEGAFKADLRIARGLDYYTGTVYEGVFVEHPQLGAVCSGGRYDNLASDDKQKLPGVGVSLGLSRILGFMFAQGSLKASRATPTLVLVALNSEEERPQSYALAKQLRERGLNTEVFHAPHKFGKQIRYAERKGIPFVMFLSDKGAELKDIRSGEQSVIDPATWVPPAADASVQIIRT
ncbi:MAG: histidyl-tRNA synthetase [Myxococcaceae bacterium]|nr:histidyl-tRNA synthetase [Myxococcaceae bacterium]